MIIGFANYTFKSLGSKNDIIKTINISKGTCDTINIVLSENISTLQSKTDTSEITQDIIIDDNISAPISYGQKLGSITYYKNDEIVGTCDLISDTNVDKITFITFLTKILYSWFNLLRP